MKVRLNAERIAKEKIDYINQKITDRKSKEKKIEKNAKKLTEKKLEKMGILRTKQEKIMMNS
jgi:hypothetical protein